MNHISKSKKSLNYSLMTIILFWCGLIVMSSMYLTIPLISLFTSTLNVSSNLAAWTTSIFCIFFAGGCLVYGPLSDRYGRKKIILVGMILLTVITPIIGLFDNIYWILSIRAAQGALAASFSPVALAYIPEMFPDSKKVTTTGFLVTGFLMAGIVGQVISGFINQFLSWNYVFYLMGLFYFFTIFLVLVFLPTDNITRVKSSVIEAINKMASLFKVKALLLCFAVDLMLLMSMMCMYTALGYYLAGPQFGLSSQQILYVRAFGIFGIIFASTSGFLVKEFELFPVLIAGLSISAISLMAMAIVSNVMLLVILSVIFVAGIAITAPALISIIAMIGGEARGSALSLHTVILFIGAGIGPVLAVTLLSTGLNYLPYLVMGIALFVGVVICLFIKQSIKESYLGKKE